MRLGVKDATVLRLLTKLPVGNARGVDLAKVMGPFEALLQQADFNLPTGIVREPTQRIGADGAPQLVIQVAFWTKEDVEAALSLDDGDGICSPTFHAHLESTNGSRRGKYLVHGSLLVGLNNDHIECLLCRLPGVSAAKVEPAYLYDDGPLRADAVVATITHTGQLARCFTVTGFQPAVWLDRKVPRMPLVKQPAAGSSQPLPTRHLPKTAQWAARRPQHQQQQGEQLRRRDQPTREARQDQQPAYRGGATATSVSAGLVPGGLPILWRERWAGANGLHAGAAEAAPEPGTSRRGRGARQGSPCVNQHLPFASTASLGCGSTSSSLLLMPS